ncbi:HD domain-containing phosphohydrolase [Desulfolutivibrio sulfoxidireducens]|uniref:HD domain-containing phosphohydrolase n=1 Tax=Desulfolutivibrio sulfoxidireducens TaxID=2773299 RepID=UPI00159DC90A|nr:HD domain-containing phosphohydrolase [Desulfolutivibrio sulfoxidireducens]QLA21339.1 response regulator [Desulfolutivibrio sulfoxidireducens]
MDKPLVLFVDDDPEMLASYRRIFRKKCHIETASEPAEGLDMLNAGRQFAVIVSDLRMPGMDGVAFLEKAREKCPETVRIMLTGYADVGAAVAAVNAGKVFSFLTKPCPEDALEAAVAAGSRQHQLVVAEKELLRGTVRGTIKLLTDLMAMINAEAFGKSSRVKRLVMDLADYMGLADPWRLELAAMLSQIGCAALPRDVLRKAYLGQPLSGNYAYEFAMHPKIAADLIANIPRLREVAEIVAYQEKRYDGGGLPPGEAKGEAIPKGARILKVALDFDTLERMFAATGKVEEPVQKALERMRGRRGWYDPAVLDALESMINFPDGFERGLLALAELKPGMILDQEVLCPRGEVVLSKGQEIGTVAIRRLRGALGGKGDMRIRVLVPPRRNLEFAELLDG